MANFYGSARTNYAGFNADKVSLVKDIACAFSIEVFEKDEKLGFFPSDNSDNGMFPSYVYISDASEAQQFQKAGLLDDEDEDFEGREIEFSWDLITQYLNDGEVLVVQEVGAEKLRYLSGYASAYTNKGMVKSISIDDIYGAVSAETGIDVDSISTCEY
jgi:hypothetical protein